MSYYFRLALWAVICFSSAFSVSLSISRPDLLPHWLLDLPHTLQVVGHRMAVNFDPCMSISMFCIILFANKMVGGSLMSFSSERSEA